jgi:hypothetical protein
MPREPSGHRLLGQGLGFAALIVITSACPQSTPKVGHTPSPSPPTSITSSSAGATAACSPAQYAYGLADEGAQGAVILDAHADYVSGTRCTVNDRVTVRLTDSSGHLLRVRGNPAVATLGAVVGPMGEDPTHPVLLAWRNWCSSGSTDFAFSVTSSRKTQRYSWSGSEPGCIDQHKPSTLRTFTSAG